MEIHSHQCVCIGRRKSAGRGSVFYWISWYCWKYYANFQVRKPLFRSEIEAAIFRAKYKLRTNAQMLIKYVSIRPLFKEKIFGRRKVKREESERQRKLKLNEAACHPGGRRDR